MENGKIVKVAGPLVVAEGMTNANMFDVVNVGKQRLIGEILEMRGGSASIQVYEETAGIRVGDEVVTLGSPLSVELGPGLISTIYDGIQRPLEEIRARAGSNIARGVKVPALSRDKKWKFEPKVKVGDKVIAGDIIGVVQETIVVEHKIMVPVGVEGEVAEIKDGEFTVEEIVCVVNTEKGKKELSMMQRWPVRVERPYKEKLPPDIPMITGQRIIDTFFPMAKGERLQCPDLLVAEKPSCSTSWQNGVT